MKDLIKRVLIALLVIAVIASVGVSVHIFIADNQREGQDTAQPIDFSPNPDKKVPTQVTEPKHEHNYVTEIKKANCVEGGYTRYTCTCGDTYLSDETKATGHTYGVPKEKEATCTSQGGTVRICTECGCEEVKNRIEKLGHSWSSWEETQKATTTAAGKKTRTCSVCGKKQTEATPKLSVASHTHKYTSNVVEATCTKEGYTRYTCSCGKTYDETIPVRSHLYGNWKVTAQATTTKEGKKEAKCERCGHTKTKTIDKLTAEEGETYEKYIDPRIEIKKAGGRTRYYYYPVSVIDARSWGDPPAIRITNSGGFSVTYLKKDGSKVKVTLEPVEGYVRRMVIQSDGSYTLSLIGDFND